jgi:hypothetical protein
MEISGLYIPWCLRTVPTKYSKWSSRILNLTVTNRRRTRTSESRRHPRHRYQRYHRLLPATQEHTKSLWSLETTHRNCLSRADGSLCSASQPRPCVLPVPHQWCVYLIPSQLQSIALTRRRIPPLFRQHLLREESAGNFTSAKKSRSSVSVSSFWALALGRSSRAQCQKSTGVELSTGYLLGFSSCLCSLWRLRRILVSVWRIPSGCGVITICASPVVYLIFRFLSGYCGAAFLSIAGGSVSDMFSTSEVAT